MRVAPTVTLEIGTVLLLLSAWACGCSLDRNGIGAGADVDAAGIDAAVTDGGTRDAGADDAPPIDGNRPDVVVEVPDACVPEAEACDLADQDCDGRVDELLTRACTTSCGAGTETCDLGSWVGCTAPTAADETCNGLDDDCDGTPDDGVTRACSTACGTGVETCAGGTFGSCTAPAPGTETCNGLDDDCDGAPDDGLTRACSTACGMGIETCAGGAFGGCTAPAPGTETCNGRDDDCDGTIDDSAGCPCELRRDAGRPYLFCTTTRSWTSARDACAMVGYALVTIDSMAENGWVESTALGIADEDWWIGLNDRAPSPEGTWGWVSGAASTFRAWAGGQPDDFGFGEHSQDCAMLTDGSAGWEQRGRWDDFDCGSSLRYVCEAP